MLCNELCRLYQDSQVKGVPAQGDSSENRTSPLGLISSCRCGLAPKARTWVASEALMRANALYPASANPRAAPMGRKALARSNTATEKPKLASPWAAHSPPGPAPIMAISKVGV